MKKKSKPKSNSLEIESSDIVTDIAQYSMWIHGRPKGGKTSLAAKFADPVFLLTEKGTKAQKVNAIKLFDKPWESYLEALDVVRDSSHETVVVDVLEKGLDRCFRHYSEEMQIESPEGNEWNLLRDPFINWVLEILNMDDKGCILISHSTNKEIKTTLGEKTDNYHPALTGKPLSQIEGEVDIIMYLGYVNEHRVLQILGDEYVMAGHRVEHGFRDTEGNAVKYIPAGASSSEAYENFLRAFENEQSPEDIAHIFPPKEETKKVIKKKKRK